MATIGFKGANEWIILLGDSKGQIGQSIWLRECFGIESGPPPIIDLPAERKTGEFVRNLIERGTVNAVHDVSDGGLAVALAEMSLAGDIGAYIDIYAGSDNCNSYAEYLFGEDQGRYVCTTRTHEEAMKIQRDAEAAGICFTYLGNTTEEREIQFGDAPKNAGNTAPIPLTDLRAAHESFFKNWMES
jgi:phosphoribosylformylglycinamidine synthase subunit PurL